MGKKNKKEKDELKVKDPEKVEDGDKVSISKTFRDTGIIMGVIAVIVGILFFATKDAVYIDAEQQGNNNQNNEDIVGDPEIAYVNLVKLANKELIGVKNLKNDVEYVEKLISLEYTASKVTFCALGNKQDDYSYLVKVTLSYSFGDEDGFIYKMTNLNLSNAVTAYSITAEAMELTFNENLLNKFDDKVFEILPKYDMDKVYTHFAYIDKGETYFAVTYAGTDSYIYSINEMLYNESLDQFTVASEYKISPEQNVKMYSLLEQFIAE